MATIRVTAENLRSQPLRAPAVPAPHSLLFELVLLIERWVERGQQRWDLRHLSDDQLKDIGLSRADVEAEAAKPFWRG